MNDKKVLVVGHKNPDTDSICAAIGYAALKNHLSEGKRQYVPCRAGQLNEETRYVLERFHVDAPMLISDVGSQVKDMEIRRTPGVSSHISMKRAWELMKELSVATLPVAAKDGRLEGLIVTVDIAMAFMDETDSHILATARTQYKNIIETINGTMLTGNEHGYFVRGKVVIPTGSPDVVAESIGDDDLVIVGNRFKSMNAALDENCSCMIVCNGNEIPEDIAKRAAEKDVVLISTPYDTFTVARLINLSIPIKFFMKRDRLITFDLEDYVQDVKDQMARVRHRDFPVLDADNHYVGMISRRNLFDAGKKAVILVDHNEKTQAVSGIEDAEILEIIDHHRIGTLETIQPVFFRNQPLGSSSTIVSLMYEENGVEIDPVTAGLLLSAIISDTLMFRSPTCTKTDREAAERLSKVARVEIEELATEMFEAGSDFKRKPIDEIFYQDFKTFSADDREFGVAQVSAISTTILDPLRKRMLRFLPEVLTAKNVEMVFVLLTDIIGESSEVLFAGEDAKEVIEAAFRIAPEEAENGSVILPGVVSRKKQFIPPIINALQEGEE